MFKILLLNCQSTKSETALPNDKVAKPNHTIANNFVPGFITLNGNYIIKKGVEHENMEKYIIEVRILLEYFFKIKQN